jgi:hypothetical protein
LNYAIIRRNGRNAGVEYTLAKWWRAVSIARCIDRCDFGGEDSRYRRFAGAKKKEGRRERERERGEKRLKVRRVKKKRECPPSVKYCPENRTVFINPARKSVFMESPPGGEEERRLFGALYVFRDVSKRSGSICGSGAFFNEDAFDFPCANNANFFLSRVSGLAMQGGA